MIAFVGSVFSPYYAWARRRGAADPEDHCALNVALYGEGHKRWTMTERGRRHVRRGTREFVIGPSRLRWEHDTLVIEIDELGMPIPHRVRGTVRVRPQALCRYLAPLDADGRHRWGPIAPCARVEVEMVQPALRWSGQAYLDANEGDEPIDRPFAAWDWSRASLRDGSTGVIYDVRPKQGADRVLALRFRTDGSHADIEAPPRVPLPRTAWRIARQARADGAQVLQTLEDTPFYQRALVRGGLLGETVTAVHETLSVPRLASTAVQLMLPWRMPRVG